tara:strand:+ start:991 stop:1140 length:150 start_codon:yes stop_codon:yes gene_type:complete
MVKCDICKKSVEETFLKKLKGTFIGKGKKKKVVCSECQKNLKEEEIDKV